MTANDLSKTIVGVFCLAGITACSDSGAPPTTIGYVEADWIYVSASTSGQIINEAISKGDRVAVGDILFELENDVEAAVLAEAEGRIAVSRADVSNLSSGARPAEIRALEAKLREAQARYLQASSEQDRIAPLVDRGIETQNRGEQVAANFAMAQATVAALIEEVNVAKLAARDGLREAADASVTTAEAARNMAAAKLAQRKVFAQVSGRVEEIFYRKGEFVAAGRAVLALLPDDGLKIKFFVAQAELPKIELGATVLVSPDGVENAVETIVSFIAAEPEFTPPVIYSNEVREKLVFLVETRVHQGSELLPGLPVSVQWN